jgi:hypothetical protein
MENAYLNTGANAKGMYALFYIIWCSSGPQSSSCIKLIPKFTEKYFLSYRFGDMKRRPKRQFYFLPKGCKF